MSRASSPVPVHPLVVFLFYLLVGAGLEQVWPVPVLTPEIATVAGYGAIGLGFATLLWAELHFRRHDTSHEFRGPTSALITTGPFARSRHPIYVGLALAFAGVALLGNSGWLLAATVAAVLTVDRLVVRHEESHLVETFGDAYREYARRVRRWL